MASPMCVGDDNYDDDNDDGDDYDDGDNWGFWLFVYSTIYLCPALAYVNQSKCM